MDYNIVKEDLVLDEFLKVYKAQVEYKNFTNDHKTTATRFALDRGDSVAVLLYEKDTDSILFTEQYRYPSSRRNHALMLELVAGAIENGESAADSCKREVLEELGYKVDGLQLIHKYFPSPGVSSEVIYLFYAEVNKADKLGEGGGTVNEKEDIKLVKLSRKRIHQKLKEHYFNNSVSIIGLQWFLLNK